MVSYIWLWGTKCTLSALMRKKVFLCCVCNSNSLWQHRKGRMGSKKWISRWMYSYRRVILLAHVGVLDIFFMTFLSNRCLLIYNDLHIVRDQDRQSSRWSATVRIGRTLLPIFRAGRCLIFPFCFHGEGFHFHRWQTVDTMDASWLHNCRKPSEFKSYLKRQILYRSTYWSIHIDHMNPDDDSLGRRKW
jgi:hypothetical protein